MAAQFFKWTKGAQPKESNEQNAQHNQRNDQDLLFRFHLFLPFQLILSDRNRVTLLNSSFAQGLVNA